jgi:hypothetical protein
MLSERNTKLDVILGQAMPEIQAHWDSCREGGLDAMTSDATGKVDATIKSYFQRLKNLPDPADDEAILAEMKTLYEALDALNQAADYGLLETDERELLVPLFIEAAVACGIDEEKYDGEPGGEYRDF